MRDLREAASQSTPQGQTLATALTAYAQADTREAQLAQLDGLIAAWGESSGQGSVYTRLAGHQAGNGADYVLETNLTATQMAHLTVLEQFNGREYFSLPWEGVSFGDSARQGISIGKLLPAWMPYWITPAGGVIQPTTYIAPNAPNNLNILSNLSNLSIPLGSTQYWHLILVSHAEYINLNLFPAHKALLDQAYSALKHSVYDALLPQTRLKPYLDHIGLTLDTSPNATQALHLDFSQVQADFIATAALNPGKAVADLIEFNRYGKELFKDTDWHVQGDTLRYSRIVANDAKFDMRKSA